MSRQLQRPGLIWLLDTGCRPEAGLLNSQLASKTLFAEKRLLTLTLTKTREKVALILKMYKLFIYGDMLYIINSFCNKYDKIAIPYPQI